MSHSRSRESVREGVDAEGDRCAPEAASGCQSRSMLTNLDGQSDSGRARGPFKPRVVV